MTPKLGVGIRATLCGCPLEARVWTDEVFKTLSWAGSLELRDKRASELLSFVEQDLADLIDPELVCLLDEVLGPLAATMQVESTADGRRLELDTDLLNVAAVRKNSGSAFFLRLPDRSTRRQVPSKLVTAAWTAQDALGLDGLLLAYRPKGCIPIGDLAGNTKILPVPAPLSSSRWLGYAVFRFGDSSATGQAIHKIFNIQELDCFFAVDPARSSVDGAIALPDIESKFLHSRGMYVAAAVERGSVSFQILGDFQFPSVFPGVTFTAACAISPTSFVLSGQVSFDDPVACPFLPMVKFGDAGLLIGFAGGWTVGAFATIYVRDLALFGAVLVTMTGGTPVPTMLSGGINSLSLSGLVRSLTGLREEDLPGLATLDLLSLDGFDLGPNARLTVANLADKDAGKVAAEFNRNLPDPHLQLDPAQIQIQAFDDGYVLVDRRWIRHYFVDGQGKVALQVQFYFAATAGEVQFSKLKITPGVFVAGVITLWNKFHIKVLFSAREGDGVLAYAQIDSLDLGFLTISESKSAATDPIGLREDSLAASLVPKVPGGPVFFLSASRRDVTFFLDGRVSLLRLATVDARIVFRAGLISIHALVEIVGVQASAIVEASYADFSSANFEFRFQLDCKGLLRKLQAVTDAIDQAVAQLRSTVANARAALAEAQDQVDSLREQIRHFDQKIQACRQAVRDASWWTRAFVVIAKGAEIAAYELAKAGIHTAMGVATAALKVADAAVAGFGGLGEAVLKVVDSAIRAATSLFFLKTVELSARANTAAVQLSAGISFVFLDREYSYSTRFKAGLLDGLEKDIATNILGQLDPDLQLLRQGKPLPPRVSMKAIGPRAVEAVEIPDIKGGDNAIRCATKVMVGIQRRYFEKFGEELPELRALNASFVSTLYSAESALDLANRTALVGELRDLPQAVRSLDPARGTDAVGTALGDALKNFDEASRKHAAVQKAADEASRARSEIERVMAEPVPPSSAFTRSTDPEVLKQRLADLLAEFREEILEIYPHDEDTDYIDLSREPKLQEICDDTLKSVGRSPAPLRMAPLAKLSTARRPYRPRL